MPTRRAILAGLACAALSPRPGLSQAAYPNRPVRIIVPFAPGGGADIVSRLLQTHLQQTLGQPFVVENRAGAAGRIGTALVAKSDADGHTLLTTTESSLVIAPHTGAVLGYDPIKDFAPVSLLTRNTVVLVVHPSVPAKTLQDYMALAEGAARASCSTPRPASVGRIISPARFSIAWPVSTSCMCRFQAPARRCRR